jgi:hypothetical protein
MIGKTLCAAVLTLSLAGSAQAATCSERSVHRRHGEVAAESRSVLVYRVHDADSGARLYYACLRAGGRPLAIGESYDADYGMRFLTISGEHVGYLLQYIGDQGTVVYVNTIDVRARRWRQFREGDLNAGTPAPAGEETGIIAADFALAADGTAVWLAHAQLGESAVTDVWATVGGHARLLARSATIDDRSLALAPHRAYWTDGGVAESATLVQPDPRSA